MWKNGTPADFYHIPQVYLRVPQVSSGSLSYLPQKKTSQTRRRDGATISNARLWHTPPGSTNSQGGGSCGHYSTQGCDLWGIGVVLCNRRRRNKEMALHGATIWAFERTGTCRASLQIATCDLEQSTSGSPTRDRHQQGRLVDGHGWQNGRASREKVVSKQVVCHWFFIWFVTLWVLHLMLTEGGVGTHADVGESDSRDVERRCLKHKETQTGASYHIIPWPLMRGGGLDSRQDIFSAVCGHGISSSSNSSTSSTITPCYW